MNTIFVSSTFRDMHFERDAIQELVYPRLNRKAQEFGQTVSFCDLRWGIDTSELESDSGSKKVLDVCMDEIDRCQPPMVVILGYRYGWIPSEGLIKDVAEKYSMQLDDLEKSVTALEIEYGALSQKRSLDNTLFYFREIEGDVPEDYLTEDEIHAKKMQELKERIRKLTNQQVKTYTLHWTGEGFEGIREFADVLSADLEKMLLPKWEQFNNMTPFEKELYTHKVYREEKGKSFRARRKFAGQLLDEIKNGQKLTIVKADSGSGKSTLFSHLANELEKDEWNVLALFSGLTAKSNTSLGIINTIIEYLQLQLEKAGVKDVLDVNTEVLEENMKTLDDIREKALNIKTDNTQEHNIKQLQKQLNTLCVRCTSEKIPVVIMLDAADQLYDDSSRENLIFVPTELSEYVRFVMTCLPELSVMGNPYVKMNPIDNNDKQDVIDGILSVHNRELSKEVVRAMLDIPASNNPLYLSFMVQRLLMMNKGDFEQIQNQGDGMAAIVNYQLDIIKRSATSLEDMSAELMEAAAERIGGNIVEKTLDYLAVSKHGLRVTDIAGILQEDFNMLDFAHFISYMNDCFIIREDGRYDFSHKSIREGLIKRCKDQLAYHYYLTKHFLELDDSDEIRKREIMLHIIYSNQKKLFADYIQYYYNKQPDTILYAAQDTYDTSVLDDGEWLLSILDVDDPQAPKASLINFLSKDYFQCMTGRFSESNTVLKVMRRTCELVKERFEQENDVPNGEIYASVCESLGRASILLNGSENNTLATTLLERSNHLLKQLADIHQTPESQKRLADSYQTLAELLGETKRSQDVLEEALKIYKSLNDKDNTEDTKKALAEHYVLMANKFNGMMISDEEKALDCANAAVELYQELYEKYGDISYKQKLAQAYLVMADIYRHTTENDNVAEFYHKSLQIMTECEKENNSLALRAQTASINNKIAEYYHHEYSFWEKSIDLNIQALKYAKQSVQLLYGIWQTLPSIDNRRNLSIAYQNLGKIYWGMEEYAEWKKCIEQYQYAIQLREELYRDTSVEEDAYALFSMYDTMSDVYNKTTSEGYHDDTELSKMYENKILTHEKYESFMKRKKAFSEVLEILRHMDRIYVDMIPKRLIMYFYDNCSLDYDFRMTKPIGEEKFLDETMRFLRMINENFWANRKKADSES